MPPEQVKEFGKKSPFERPAQPAELAPAYIFPASGEASYVTGSVMDMTGGKMLPYEGFLPDVSTCRCEMTGRYDTSG